MVIWLSGWESGAEEGIMLPQICFTFFLYLMHRGPVPAPLAGLRSAALFSYLCTRSKASREQGIRGRHKIGAISPKVQDHQF